MKTKTLLAAALAALSLGVSAPALAHPKLVSSSPAATATVAATNRLTLTFSEHLMPRLSGIDLAMTGMPGMANHAPMKIGGVKTTVGEDGKTLIAALPRPLAAGTYRVTWSAAGADTHRMGGNFSFTVR